MRKVFLAVAAAVSALMIMAVPAAGLVLSPVSIDGPGNGGIELGGTALAPDGTGGIVYTKLADGVPHVFASLYDGSGWSAPIRVDWDQPYEASSPRIAAGEGGRLLVVWVTQVATVNDSIRRGLFSASLGGGSGSFEPSLLIDPDVGDGAGVTPALAGTEPGKAIVAYRSVVEDFGSGPTERVRLRPGDVIAEVRLARLGSDHWSGLGTVNRDAAVSGPPPTVDNAPQVATGATGNAVVAWQEREQDGTARIWWRRVLGTSLGPILPASPASWQGKPVGEEADAFSLDVTPFDQARIATRVSVGARAQPGAARLFFNTLPPNFIETAGRPTGPVSVDGGSTPGVAGDPSIAASDEGGGGDGSFRLAYAAGDGLRQYELDHGGGLSSVSTPGAPGALAGTPVVAAVDPAGGGLAAWLSRDGTGRPVVAVRQDFASGAAQTGLLSGARAAAISGLAIGRNGAGEALIAFRQGNAGLFQLLATRVTVPPQQLSISAPEGWVRPPRARLRWEPAPSTVGGVTYAVVLDGRVVKRGLKRRRFRPGPRLLGSGVHRVQVLATDRLGQQLLSRGAKLGVDARPPRVRIEVDRRRGSIVARLRDRESGLRGRATVCSFGDGKRQRGGRKCAHSYKRAGRFTLIVRARDRARNKAMRRFTVRVR